MRDSNYSFPVQNRVCVSITAQLYDRRALDTSSMLPLLHSLTHLTYLTSTSPRIRDILVIDGGLERLLEILQESALPRPPASPIPDWYSLRGPHTASIINLQQQISLRHSLAFQCVVNIGVRGNELVRTRVVQSGALDVVAQIMEVWLKGKGVSIHAGPLGSQAAVDRASAGMQPWYVSSRHRHRHRDREREKYRESRESAHDYRNGTSPPPFPENRSSRNRDREREPMGSAAFGIPAGRVLTRESLERSLVPQDEPTPEDIIVNMLTIDQRAVITRINAVARLAGIDREYVRRAVVQPNDQSNGMWNLFRNFGLDLRVLLALEGANTHNGGGRPEFDDHLLAPRPVNLQPARSLRMAGSQLLPGDNLRALSVTPDSAAEPEDDVLMRNTQQQEAEDRAATIRQSRRGTLTSGRRHEIPPPRQVENLLALENPTPRAIPPVLPPLGAANRPRPGRISSFDTGARLPVEQRTSSLAADVQSRSFLEPSAGSYAGTSRPSLVSRRTSSRPIFDTTSNTSTPAIDTPPPIGRERSGTLTDTRLQATAQDPRLISVGPGEDIRSTSRAGTEDEESALGDVPLQLADEQDQDVGIVGATDDETVEVLSGLVQGDMNDRTQAEVDLAMGAPPGAPGATQTPRLAEMTPRETMRNNLPNPMQTPTLRADRQDAAPFAAVIAAGAPRGFSDLSDLVNVIESTAPNGDVTYSDDTILLCLQLLAYLSKYAHVRAAFHHPKRPMHQDCDIPDGYPLPERPSLSESNNMFSLVERFTFRPSGPDPDMQRLPADITYWAGVIMRNACRKDDFHGGIRQCANMTCGRWENFPREFAKCRRCRKAKYCSKECQSKAWQEGHRFWCNAREPEPDEAPISGTVIIGGGRQQQSDRRQRREQAAALAEEELRAQADGTPGLAAEGIEGGANAVYIQEERHAGSMMMEREHELVGLEREAELLMARDTDYVESDREVASVDMDRGATESEREDEMDRSHTDASELASAALSLTLLWLARTAPREMQR